MNPRAEVVHSGMNLEYFTVGWNLLEAAVGLTAGAVAGSIALIGFGLDSVIEVSSGAVLIWRLRSDRNERLREAVERRALKLVAITLLALSAYVAVESVAGMVRQEAPDRSFPGLRWQSCH